MKERERHKRDCERERKKQVIESENVCERGRVNKQIARKRQE